MSKSEDAAERGGDIWLGSIDTPAHLVHVSDLGRIASEHTASSGAGGDVHISAANVELERGGQIFARTTGAGDSGNVTLHDADRVSVLGWEDGRNITAIATLADSAASGRGGDLEIHTRLLEVQDAGEIQTRTLGVGSAGDTLIVASERVTIQGGKNGFAIVSAGSSTPDLAAVGGKGGTLTIKAPVLELLDGGSVTTSIKGPGSGGQLNVFADRIEISGQSGESRSGLFSQSNSQVLGTPPDGMEEEWGRAGNIFVEVGELALGAGGRISAETDGPGDGGSIEITAEREISLTGAADISALSRGEGAAGEVRIDAGKSLTLVERSKITTEAKQSRGGKITIQARELVYLVDSEITTEVDLGADKGGDVLIDPDFVVLDNGDVIARADRGDGGAITIVADHLFRSEGSDIDPSSERGGLDGELVVEPPETEVIGQLTTLETSLVDASSLLTTPCAARTAPAGSFVVSGRSPLAASPDAPLSWLDVAGLDGFAPAGSVCPAQATP